MGRSRRRLRHRRLRFDGRRGLHGGAVMEAQQTGQVARLAHDMHAHVVRAVEGGLPVQEIAQAVALLNGLLLASAYKGRKTREVVACQVADAAVDYAGRLDARFGRAPH